uniref:Uncharacterized protein n=1 Tax=Panstrongylus lignarius TaxID=156445 RepID=A0A224Y6J3_9HEMI
MMPISHAGHLSLCLAYVNGAETIHEFMLQSIHLLLVRRRLLVSFSKGRHWIEINHLLIKNSNQTYIS